MPTAYELKFNQPVEFKELCTKTFTKEEGALHAPRVRACASR